MAKASTFEVTLEDSSHADKAILIGVQTRGVPIWEVNDHLDELEQLLDTARGVSVGRFVQERSRPDPGTFLGTGKVEELKGVVSATEADLVVFDDDLTPAQNRNLEKKLDCRVLDRAGLILEIFAQRARTREAKIQVSLAQLLYLLPRLTGRWLHFSRQYGGTIMRGPGETQLEMDRQAIKRRVTQLRAELSRIERARETRRHRREDVFKVAIIGYTNAGKSTLLNSLTHSNVFVEDRLFATLDPTIRALRLKDGLRVLLIDTVGFIRKLPVGLVASFRSTLEESRQADLFIHVVDISHPHWEGQLARTEELLTEMKLAETPQVLVFNKVDAVDDTFLIEGLRRQFPGALFISALRGIRLYELPERISEFAHRRWVRGTATFRPDETDRLLEYERDVRVIGRSFHEGLIHLDYLTPEKQKRAES